jgi:hypothetical protein
MAHPPLLDLTTLVDPRYVRIDGVLHELRRPDQLSIAQIAELEQLRPQMAQLQQLQGATTLSGEDLATAVQAMVRLCAIVLAAPAAVQARLSDLQRLAVLQAFMQLSAPPRLAPGAARGTVSAVGRRSTGASSRRGSRASTAALRPTG